MTAKMATLTDAFPGTALNTSLWYVEPDSGSGGASGTVTVSGGSLNLGGGVYEDTGYYTSVNSVDPYDLTSSSAFVRVIPNTGNSDYDTGFSVMAGDFSNGLTFGVAGGQLYVQSWDAYNYTTVHSAAYNAVNHAWLKISESGGTITFSTSPDSETWSSFYTTTTENVNTWHADDSYIQFYYGSVSGDSKPAGAGSFQDFNVAGSGGGGGTSGSGAVVQETGNSTTGRTLTLAFDEPLTPGNTVIVALAGYYGGSVSGITIGGDSGKFSRAAASGGFNAELWAAYSVTEATETIVVATTAGGILGWAYEVTGVVVALDKQAGNYGSGTAWSSGATGETIPYQHVIFGVGAVIGNAGSVTPTGSGWTNGTAFEDVAGSNPLAVGGVSGYQNASGPGTYAYAGTSAEGSSWAAVTAAFLCLPSGRTQPGWGGYVFQEHPAYTGVSATFTLPALAGGTYDSIWVGLGNVFQVGVYQTYDTSQPGNSASRPWSWWLPGSGEQWQATAYPAAAGDSLTMSVQLTSDTWVMTITNHTKGWTFAERRSVLAVNIGSIANLGEGPAVWPYPVTTAEVIVEREGGALPEYGSVTFTNITTTPAVAEAPIPVFTVNASVDQYPGPYNEGAFTMNWNGYS